MPLYRSDETLVATTVIFSDTRDAGVEARRAYKGSKRSARAAKRRKIKAHGRQVVTGPRRRQWAQESLD